MNMSLDKRKLWLCLVPVGASLMDHIFTMAGQSREYWTGNYAAIRETAPHARWLLEQHPLVFVTACILYTLVYCAVIVLCPVRLSRILALALVIGHCWGIGSW